MAAMEAILDFPSEQFYLFLIYKPPWMIPTKFQDNWLRGVGVGL